MAERAAPLRAASVPAADAALAIAAPAAAGSVGVRTLALSAPFSAMAVCTPAGAEMLAEEGEDDAICAEDAASRRRVQARLAEMIAEELGLR